MRLPVAEKNRVIRKAEIIGKSRSRISRGIHVGNFENESATCNKRRSDNADGAPSCLIATALQDPGEISASSDGLFH